MRKVRRERNVTEVGSEGQRRMDNYFFPSSSVSSVLSIDAKGAKKNKDEL